MNRGIDRRHDHAGDQCSSTCIGDTARQEMSGQVDEVRFRAVELDVDLMSSWCLVHDQQMQLVEFVLLDQEVDDRANDDLETGLWIQAVQQVGEPRCRRFDVSFGESDEKRVLVREVLIERSDRHFGLVGDVVGGGSGIALLVEDASRGIQDAFDRATGPLLTRGFAG